MKDKKKKNKAKNIPKNIPKIEMNSDALKQCIILLIIVLCIWRRFFIVQQIGIQGSGYFFSVYDFMVAVMVLFPFSIRQIVYKLVYNRASLMQFKNAFRVMYTGIIMAVLFSLVSIFILYFCSDVIVKHFLLGKTTELTLFLIIPSLLFLALSGVIRGFFEGVGSQKPGVFISILEQLGIVLSILIFSDIFLSYGEKVAKVMQNPEVLYAYGAAGTALGYLIGSLLGFIASFGVYILNKKQIRRKARRDETRKNEDVYDLFVIIFRHLLPVAITLFLLQGYELVDQWIFFKFQNSLQEKALLSYQFGAYSGIYRSLVLCPVLLIFAYQITDTHLLELGMRSGDFHEVRFKAFSMLNHASVVGFGFASFFLVMARPLVETLFLTESDLAVKLLRVGFSGILFLCFAVSTILIMLGIGKNHMALMNGLISLFIHVLLVFTFVNRTGLGIYGILISFLIFGITASLLNYLSLSKELKGNINFSKSMLMPLVSAIIAGVVILISGLIFGLFMPAWLNVTINAILFVIVYFICLMRTGCLNAYMVENSRFCFLFAPLGKLLKVIH